MKNAMFLLAGLLMTTHSPVHATVLFPDVDVRLTSVPGGNRDERVLPCHGTLYAYWSDPMRPFGRYQIEGRWIRPDGKTQEHASFFVEVDAAHRAGAYFWLRFNNGSILDALRSRGREAAERNLQGQWHFQVALNGQVVSDAPFEVRCVK